MKVSINPSMDAVCMTASAGCVIDNERKASLQHNEWWKEFEGTLPRFGKNDSA
jgi:hypothetical protein